MYSFKKRQGFTIVELLIVIVVIGILATLVIVTFTGIQQRARDTQRKTDLAAVASHLEAYYADQAHYPLVADLNTLAWRQTNMKGLDSAALDDPKGAANAGFADGASTTSQYGYAATDSAGDPCAAAAIADCTHFVITATLESDGSVYSKSSN